MQFGVIVICALIGFTSAQRGHYAGANRPILGTRYQNVDQTQSNVAQPSSGVVNRIDDSPVPTFQQQPGSGFANPGESDSSSFGGFPVGPYGR